MESAKRWMKRIAILGLVAILALPVSVALANWLNPPAAIVNDLAIGANPSSVYGMTFQPDRQTFYAKGRHWIFYINNDSDFVYKTALDNGVFGAETELVATTGIYGMEMAVFYDATNDKVHYARHDMTPAPDEVKYRMGVPNADGTITWAAVEQTIATTPAALLTWRTTITVDETGMPIVAWIDTDGVGTDGIVYVERSTTANGTWTQDAAFTTTFVAGGGTAVDGTGTMTGSPVTLVSGANTPTITVEGTFTITLPQGTTGTAVSDGWAITGSPVTLTEGANVITVEAGGAGTITINTTEARHAWLVAVTPCNNVGDVIEVEWSWEDTSGGADDGDIGVYAKKYNTGTGWAAIDTVVAKGSMHATRPDAFSFFDVGASVYVLYTDVTGNVMYRVRSSIQTWNACAAAVQILAAGAGGVYCPTISGYRTSDTGDDLIAIVHDDNDITYSIYEFETITWSAFTTAWTTPAAADTISRHIATVPLVPPDLPPLVLPTVLPPVLPPSPLL